MIFLHPEDRTAQFSNPRIRLYAQSGWATHRSVFMAICLVLTRTVVMSRGGLQLEIQPVLSGTGDVEGGEAVLVRTLDACTGFLLA